MNIEVRPSDVKWLNDRIATSNRHTCPVCRSEDVQSPMLAVPSLVPPHPTMTLLRCVHCGSGFYDPPGIGDFTELNQDRGDFWRFYVESGGGIWEMIWPLLAPCIEGSRKRSLLDVGCGFGFAADFWHRTGRGDSVGLELAEYGRIGAAQLGITVHAELLQDCKALVGRRFDVVYASEVIEHVPDPAAFVAELAARVADDGILVLTTPAIEYVRQENLSPTLLAAILPGLHGFLLSSEKFGELARAEGLPYVEVRRFAERQILWASRVPFALDVDPVRLRPAYFEYMESRTSASNLASPLGQGYAYRLLRDYVNTGRLREAVPLCEELCRAVVTSYGVQIAEPATVLHQLTKCRTLSEFGRVGPYFLPQLYYFQAAIAQHVRRDAVIASRLYRATSDIARELSRLSAISFLEAISLVWPARVHEAELRLAGGDTEYAARVFEQLAREGTACKAEHAFAMADVALIDTVVPRASQSLFTRGREDLAREVFIAYLESLSRRSPGIDWTDVEVVEAHLAGQPLNGAPSDPTFPAFFAGLIDLRGQGNARLQAFHALALRHAGHADHGARLAHHASVAAGYLPSPVRKPIFEYSFNMTLPKKP